MLRNHRGFTLIEALVTAAIIVFGMLAVASIFSYSITVNRDNRQLTLATTLLDDKMEEFRSVPVDNAAWSPGGNLNPDSPYPGYIDDVSIDEDSQYFRIWQVTDNAGSRTVTVVVFASHFGLMQNEFELARATTVR